jgi:hypothetical protein
MLEPGAERLVHLVARKVHEARDSRATRLFELQPIRERPLGPAALLDEPGQAHERHDGDS